MSAPTDRWAEIAARFDELVELAPVARARRLSELVNLDPALAADVRALLAADDSGNSLLDVDATAALPDLLADQDSTPGDGICRMVAAVGCEVS